MKRQIPILLRCYLAIGLVGTLYSCLLWAEEPKESPLPEIEAKTYEIQLHRKSHSLRVYLFNDLEEAHPVRGRILLTKSLPEEEPAMAFRVLKDYPEKKQFAARWVRKYGEHKLRSPPLDVRLKAIEKVRDLTPEELARAFPPAVKAADDADLKDLESTMTPLTALPQELTPASPQPTPEPLPPAEPEGSPSSPTPTPEPEKPLPVVPAYDPELDSGTSPAPLRESNEEDSDEPGLDDEDFSVREFKPLDLYRGWASVQLAFARNRSLSGGTKPYDSFGGRFGLTVAKQFLVNQATVQDSVTVELGLFGYKILKYETADDAYTLLATLPTVRYNLQFGENFLAFIHLGLLKNFVLSSANASDTGRSNLGSTLVAAGGGVLFRIGPHWYVRGDFGFDATAFGLTLRF